MTRHKRNKLIWNTYIVIGVVVALAFSIPQEGLLIYALLWIILGHLLFERWTRPQTRYHKLRRNGGIHSDAEWYAVQHRQGFRCACCQNKRPLTRDHVIPVSLGGCDSIDNIQGLCQSCNSIKGTKIIDYR